MRLGIILDWLEKYSPDVLALQETKCQDHQFPVDAITDAGWNVVCRGQKSYNGVAMITRQKVDKISFGLGDGDEDESAPRLAHIRLGDVEIINTYVPQGYEIGSDKFAFKLEWFKRLRKYFEKNFDSKKSKLVWVGDLNVAPTEIDVYDPKGIWPHVCYCQEVIDAFNDVVDWGLIDVFRKHIPGEGVFTFWDYRMRGSASRNRGWRLDHVLATVPMAELSTECFVDIEPRKAEKPSDHTFVAARFE